MIAAGGGSIVVIVSHLESAAGRLSKGIRFNRRAAAL
jgi:hypothetical protein